METTLSLRFSSSPTYRPTIWTSIFIIDFMSRGLTDDDAYLIDADLHLYGPKWNSPARVPGLRKPTGEARLDFS